MLGYVVKRSGRNETYNSGKIRRCIERACLGLEDVNIDEMMEDVSDQLYEGISTTEIDKALILIARQKIDYEPNYSKVAANLLNYIIYKEVFNKSVTEEGFEQNYRDSFVKNIKLLVEKGLLKKEMLEFDLELLARNLTISRDFKFKYVGLQTIYDRYLIELDGKRLETPQAFWMRVAMGLALKELDKDKAAFDFYTVFSQFLYCPSTPTLFNSGLINGSLASCFLTTFGDSINGIYRGLHNEALKSKNAGGLGIDVTYLRGANSTIGINGKADGIIPAIKVIDSTLAYVNQKGKRRGSGCVYCELWHLDIEDFIQLKKETGDERRRAHDTNIAIWIPDEFMERVKNDENWYLFSPIDVPDLHDLFGLEFKFAYRDYIKKVESGLIKNVKIIKAKDLWKKILSSAPETGHPWHVYKDPCNLMYPNRHIGNVHSSNLCSEIVEHTISTTYNKWGDKLKVGEDAVCVIGSINLMEHMTEDGTLDEFKLRNTCRWAVRILDNVIENGDWPTEEAYNGVTNNRQIGVGMMGLQDYLFYNDILYDSEEGVNWSERISESLSYYVVEASIDLAKERGVYPNYKGSSWSRGVLPIDQWKAFLNYRGKSDERSESKNWDLLRTNLLKHGIRHGNLLATAPTACVSEDTYILSEKGIMPIEYFKQNDDKWQNIDVNIIQEGSSIYKATKFYNNGFNKVTEIITKRGHSIKCTDNHRLRVLDINGDYVWKYVKDLELGDVLVRKIGGHKELLGNKEYFKLDNYEKNINEKDINIPYILEECLAELLGYYIGDGYLKDDNLALVISIKDKDLVDRYSKFIKDLFNIDCKIEYRKSECLILRAFSVKLVKWWLLNCFDKSKDNKGEGSESAFIPKQILQSNTSVISAFFKGLFEAGGTVTKNVKGSVIVSFSTVSEKLAKQSQICLEALGMKVSITKKKPGTFSYRPIYETRIANINSCIVFKNIVGFASENKCSLLFELLDRNNHNGKLNTINNKNLAREFRTTINLSCMDKKDRTYLNSICSHGIMNIDNVISLINKYSIKEDSRLRQLVQYNLDFVPIKEIRCGEFCQTYDLEVPDNNTYIANGFISHNTISFMVGCSQSIESMFNVIFVYSTLSGDFTQINEFFVKDMKKIGCWSKNLANKIKSADGDLSLIEEVPDNLKRKYRDVFKQDFKYLIKANAVRQKYIDQSQSFNIYYDGKSMKAISDIYMQCYENCLKSTYYFRNKGASKIEKITLKSEEKQLCSIESAMRGEICEACQ